eukprot:Skav225143  [mRNA]  locus=scaffold1056:202774:205608:+ [translate_table: standard]
MMHVAQHAMERTGFDVWHCNMMPPTGLKLLCASLWAFWRALCLAFMIQPLLYWRLTSCLFVPRAEEHRMENRAGHRQVGPGTEEMCLLIWTNAEENIRHAAANDFFLDSFLQRLEHAEFNEASF